MEDKATDEVKDTRFCDRMGKARRLANETVEEGYDWMLDWQWNDAKCSWTACSRIYRFTILLIEVES